VNSNQNPFSVGAPKMDLNNAEYVEHISHDLTEFEPCFKTLLSTAAWMTFTGPRYMCFVVFEESL